MEGVDIRFTLLLQLFPKIQKGKGGGRSMEVEDGKRIPLSPYNIAATHGLPQSDWDELCAFESGAINREEVGIVGVVRLWLREEVREE
ncbi:hypothetical protein Pyn_18477 [Prunus yedoensis var. nudiflora]|uniref:Uncharacterized protein n=1 Tax=Prunus yedoensis var. nudiflora TaxID=2094558 RepID=A0A314YML7_PRUYE|nr:hypothetical protein Pyn_18477 [Prunus yedoensis var. nudiflora]